MSSSDYKKLIVIVVCCTKQRTSPLASLEDRFALMESQHRISVMRADANVALDA